MVLQVPLHATVSAWVLRLSFVRPRALVIDHVQVDVDPRVIGDGLHAKLEITGGLAGVGVGVGVGFCPGVGLAEGVALGDGVGVGVGANTVTAKEPDVLPPGPEAVRVKVVLAEIVTDFDPENTMLPTP